jgi:hypothetical protein
MSQEKREVEEQKAGLSHMNIARVIDQHCHFISDNIAKWSRITEQSQHIQTLGTIDIIDLVFQINTSKVSYSIKDS